MARRRPGLGRLPTPLRRRMLVTLGAIEDRLLASQAEAGAAFVRQVADELPVEQALSVYLRLVDVPERHQETVARQVLANLDEQRATPEVVEGDYGPDDLVSRVIRRIRGRRHDELRARVASGAARAREVTREIYLDGAREVTRILQGTLQPAEAVQLYVDALEIPPEWAEVVFHDAMAGLGREAA